MLACKKDGCDLCLMESSQYLLEIGEQQRESSTHHSPLIQCLLFNKYSIIGNSRLPSAFKARLVRINMTSGIPSNHELQSRRCFFTATCVVWNCKNYVSKEELQPLRKDSVRKWLLKFFKLRSSKISFH